MPISRFVALFALLPSIACAHAAPTTSAPLRPTLAFVTAPKDTHFIELSEWVERHNVFIETTPQRKRFEVTVVGCNGSTECFFLHENNGKTHVFEPRLKIDWTKTLQTSADGDNLRHMECVATAALIAECKVWNSERTRTDLIHEQPQLARMMHLFRRSPAEVNIIHNRRGGL